MNSSLPVPLPLCPPVLLEKLLRRARHRIVQRESMARLRREKRSRIGIMPCLPPDEQEYLRNPAAFGPQSTWKAFVEWLLRYGPCGLPCIRDMRREDRL